MTRLRISIVMCAHNASAFLPQQLDSLLAQTPLPDKIVIGDDASVDATPAMPAAFAERAREQGVAVRLRLNPHNRRYVENFSEGLRESGGDIISLCDQDDPRQRKSWPAWRCGSKAIRPCCCTTIRAWLMAMVTR